MGYLLEALVTCVGDIIIWIMEIFANDFLTELTIVDVAGGNNFGGTFDEMLPGVKSLKLVLRVISVTIILLLMMLLLVRAMLPDTGEGKAQHPFMTIGRGALSILCAAYSYSIMALFQAPMVFLFNEATSIRKSESTGLSEGFRFGQNAGNDAENFEFPSFDELVDNLMFGDELAASVLAIAMLLIITWAFIKLLLEMVERYVILGFLFYAAPLPMAALVSDGTHGIFKSYMKMMLSQYLILMLNMLFMYVFFYAFTLQPDVSDADNTVSFTLLYYAVMLAWLRLGRSLDEHLSSMGMSVAQTGAGLGSELLGSLLAVGIAGRAAMGALRGGRGIFDKVTKNSSGAGSRGSYQAGNMSNVTADALGKRIGPAKTGKEAGGLVSKELGIPSGFVAEGAIKNGVMSATDEAGNSFDFKPERMHPVPSDGMKISKKGSDGQVWSAAVQSTDALNSPIVRDAVNDSEVAAGLQRLYPGSSVAVGATAGTYSIRTAEGQLISAYNENLYTSSASATSIDTHGIAGQKICMHHAGVGDVAPKTAYSAAHDDGRGGSGFFDREKYSSAGVNHVKASVYNTLKNRRSDTAGRNVKSYMDKDRSNSE